MLTNKYAERLSRPVILRRLRACRCDRESARDRKEVGLFGAEHVNVQPHSGSQANMAVYMTAVKPGDTVLGLDLAHGGHLTHGMKLNVSGILYHFVSYGVTRDTHRIDFDQVARLAKEHKPKMIVARLRLSRAKFPTASSRRLRRDVGAKLFVDKGNDMPACRRRAAQQPHAGRPTSGLHHHAQNALRPASRHGHVQGRIREGFGPQRIPGIQGGPLMHIVAAGEDLLRRGAAQARRSRLRPTDHRQRPHAGRGAAQRRFAADERRHADNHLMLVDVTPLGLAGKGAEEALGQCGITVNKNMIPYDASRWTRPAFESARRPFPLAAWALTKCARSARGFSNR